MVTLTFSEFNVRTIVSPYHADFTREFAIYYIRKIRYIADARR